MKQGTILGIIFTESVTEVWFLLREVSRSVSFLSWDVSGGSKEATEKTRGAFCAPKELPGSER